MSKYTRRPALEEEVCVHAMSRVVQKRFLIDEAGMEEMRRILRTQAEFAGIEVITFCFLKNHFHILVHIDPESARMEVSDDELVRRFRGLYGTKRSPSLGADAEILEVVLKDNGERAVEARQRLKARMGDVSVFMRELKTRFTFWYNEHYQTVGTFWAERFRSVLVEPGSLALRAIAAYIDLNPVRAGLAETPQSYRYCGLGEAAGGQQRARAAYVWLVRRGKGRSGTTKTAAEVYADYVAHVGRMMCQIQNQVEDAAPMNGYAAKGGAMGSAAWVQKLRRPGELFGFLSKGKATPCTAENGELLYVARRWRSDK